MGLQLVFWGLFKKIVIADRANMYVNQIFNFHDQYDGLYVIIGMLLYTLQLYAEFSGVWISSAVVRRCLALRCQKTLQDRLCQRQSASSGEDGT